MDDKKGASSAFFMSFYPEIDEAFISSSAGYEWPGSMVLLEIQPNYRSQKLQAG